jgi:hypothetical protein
MLEKGSCCEKKGLWLPTFEESFMYKKRGHVLKKMVYGSKKYSPIIIKIVANMSVLRY